MRVSVLQDLIGYLDEADGEYFRGWAADRSDPNKTIRVAIRVNGVTVAENDADLPRDDLAGMLGKTRVNHGFHITTFFRKLDRYEDLELVAISDADSNNSNSEIFLTVRNDLNERLRGILVRGDFEVAQKLSPADVISAYRMTLDRPPENGDVIQHYINCHDRVSMIRAIIASSEYQSKRQAVCLKVELDGIKMSFVGNPHDPYFQGLPEHLRDLGKLRWITSDVEDAPQNMLLDIGANIGISTIVLAKFRRNAVILAVEPSEENFRFLIINLFLNMAENVTSFKTALSDCQKKLNFHHQGVFSHVVTDNHLAADVSADEISATTLDILVSERAEGRRVCFIKLDAEGHEPNIIAGGRKTLCNDRPLIYMEFNTWCLNALGGHSPAAFAKEIWQEFDVYNLSSSGKLELTATRAYDFLHANIAVMGGVSDLILKYRDK